MKKLTFLLFTALIFSGITTGCGYKFGSLAHPQLESVAVAPVINDTLAYNASTILRGVLTERFTVDGSLKLVSMHSADCIIYARITDVAYKPIGYGSDPNGDDTFLANEWNCKVTVEFSAVIPGRGKPLIKNQQTTGSASFFNGPDMETSRHSAMRQAFLTAAKNIVSRVTEGW
ncbi:MAG: hypothetical protein IKC82_04785 [Lentisphaeria bacterium]|nr:hypothetical protein [Lentisphaeria bacterium]